MPMQWDIAVYDKKHRLALLVEVKVNLGVSETWAERWWSNVFAYEEYPEAPYFLWAFPDIFFLWEKTQDFDSYKDQWRIYSINAQQALKPYFLAADLLPETISPSSFELIVGVWLNRMTQEADNMTADLQNLGLVDSGLWQVLAGGSVRYGVEA